MVFLGGNLYPTYLPTYLITLRYSTSTIQPHDTFSHPLSLIANPNPNPHLDPQLGATRGATKAHARGRGDGARRLHACVWLVGVVGVCARRMQVQTGAGGCSGQAGGRVQRVREVRWEMCKRCKRCKR